MTQSNSPATSDKDFTSLSTSARKNLVTNIVHLLPKSISMTGIHSVRDTICSKGLSESSAIKTSKGNPNPSAKKKKEITIQIIGVCKLLVYFTISDLETCDSQLWCIGDHVRHYTILFYRRLCTFVTEDKRWRWEACRSLASRLVFFPQSEHARLYTRSKLHK